MSDQEMKDLWNEANDGATIKYDLPLLVANLEGAIKKRDRSIFIRDTREIGAALIVMIFFGQMAIAGEELISRIANVLITLLCLYVIFRLLGVRKHRKTNDFSKSLKEQLTQQKKYLKQQVHLINTAWSWGLLPFLVLIMISMVGARSSEVFNWSEIVLPMLIFSLLGLGVYFLNKRVVRTTYKPMIQSIENVLSQLDENNN